MEVSFEILIVLNTAILFTIAYILSGNFKARIIFSMISALCWVALGIGFMGTNPTYPGFAWLFILIFVILILATLYDTLEMLKEKRWGTELE